MHSEGQTCHKVYAKPSHLLLNISSLSLRRGLLHFLTAGTGKGRSYLKISLAIYTRAHWVIPQEIPVHGYSKGFILPLVNWDARKSSTDMFLLKWVMLQFRSNESFFFTLTLQVPGVHAFFCVCIHTWSGERSGIWGRTVLIANSKQVWVARSILDKRKGVKMLDWRVLTRQENGGVQHREARWDKQIDDWPTDRQALWTT